MPTTAYRTTLSLLAPAAASPALAQQADGDYSITVIGDRLAAEDTNASWSVIDEQDLNRAQNGAAADLLARLPGVALPHYRSEEHTSELQSLMRNPYDVFCLK